MMCVQCSDFIIHYGLFIVIVIFSSCAGTIGGFWRPSLSRSTMADETVSRDGTHHGRSEKVQLPPESSQGGGGECFR